MPTLTPRQKRTRRTGPARARRPMPLVLRRLLRLSPWPVAGLVVAGLAGWSLASGHAGHGARMLHQEALLVSARLGLRVEQVYASGRERLEREALLAALGAETGMPILAFDPRKARERIERLPWVASVSVERRLPDSLHVAIIERRPLALWQRGGQLTLIDEQGRPIPGQEPGGYAHLPLVVGDGAASNALAMIRMIDRHPELAERLEALVRVGNRRWDIRFTGNVTVRLPEIGAGEALDRLAGLHRREQILDRAIVVVDLRIADRLVLQTLPPEAGGRPAPRPRPTPARDA